VVAQKEVERGRKIFRRKSVISCKIIHNDMRTMCPNQILEVFCMIIRNSIENNNLK
jgi:hypothetical protein